MARQGREVQYNDPDSTASAVAATCALYRHGTLMRAAVFATLLAGLQTNAARAITLDFVLNPGSETPAFDPAGIGLMRMFDFAKTFYEDVFEDDDFALIIDVAWLDLVGIAGIYTPTLNTIRIDSTPANPWFIDPTPANDSEFTKQQVLWRDLTDGPDGTKADWYSDFGASANVPSTFEAGYFGDAPGLINQGDLLTIVLHEVGHALGLNTTITETVDGDFDFDPNWVFGANLAVETANELPEPSDDNLDIGHLENPNAVMGQNPLLGRRHFPSHTDLFAMAGALGFQELDVPRREFYGGTDWHVDGNWSGAKRPDEADEAFIRIADVTLNANGLAGALHVSEGADVTISNGVKLDLDNFSDEQNDAIGDADVTGPNSFIRIQPAAELEAREVTLNTGGEILMFGGTLDVEKLVMQTSGAGLEAINGSATVDVSDLLTNNGQIRASGGGTMTLVSAAASPWDLDGTNETGTGVKGALLATGGSIIFAQGTLADNTFDGTITIDGGGSITMPAGAWRLGQLATLTFDGDGELDGDDLTVSGDVEVTDGDAVIHSPLELFPNGTITISQIGRLDVNGPFEHSGGTLNVESNLALPITDGLLRFNDIATITTNTLANIDGNVAFNGPTEFVRGNYQGQGRIVFSNTGTIQADANIGVDSIFVTGGAADVTVSGATLNLGDVTVGNTSGGTLVLEAGAILDTDFAGDNSAGDGTLTIGENSNSDGHVIVTGVQDGNRSTVVTERSIRVGIGNPSIGRLTISDGALVDSPGMVIGSTFNFPNFTGEGHITVGGAVDGFDAELVVAGGISLFGGTLAPSSITINNGGRVEAQTLTVWNGSTVTQNGGELNLNTLDLTTNGGAFNMTGGVMHAETVNGDFEPTGGIVAPGESAGTTTITGNYFPQSGATLEIEIGGLIAGSGHDALIVDGMAALSGTLSLALIDPYLPDIGDQFQIITAGQLSGAFTTVLGVEIGPGLAFDVLYDTVLDTVTLAVTAALPGDYNLDGVVNAADYTVWRDNLGSMATLPNDPTPGMVTQEDYDTWEANFGATAGSGSLSNAVVPEPPDAVLFVVAAAIVSVRGRSMSCRVPTTR